MLGLSVPRIYLQSGCHLHNGVGEMRISVLDRFVEWVVIDRSYILLNLGGAVMICNPLVRDVCLAYRSHAFIYISAVTCTVVWVYRLMFGH